MGSTPRTEDVARHLLEVTGEALEATTESLLADAAR